MVDKYKKYDTLLGTISATVSATAMLVGVHHYYRKQRQPDAELKDYLVGLGAQARLLSTTNIPRLQYAFQQAKKGYQHYDVDGCEMQMSQNDRSTDLLARHTTTIISRPVCWVSGVASMPKKINLDRHHKGTVNQNNNDSGVDFGVVGIDADRQIVWQTTMPERVHDIVVQPFSHSADELVNASDSHNDSDNDSRNHERDVVVMGRRPSEQFWVLDTATGQVKTTIAASENRHFYGHACYSLDGRLLYVTENDTVSLNGKVGIYDVSSAYKKIAEFDSHGIGPHELIMHPDAETLIVANGGIKTEQASREELNLDTMHPSLVYLNRHTGQLLEQVTPEHNQMSIRHLGMHDDGTVMIGIQFQGEKHINVPLVLTHKRGDAEFAPLTMPNNQWQRFHQYIASVAVDSEHDLLCVTTPIGGCAAVYDLNTRKLIDGVDLPDCAGASVLLDKVSGKSTSDKVGFIVSDGQGQLTALEVKALSHAESSDGESFDKNSIVLPNSKGHAMSFDNHLQTL